MGLRMGWGHNGSGQAVTQGGGASERRLTSVPGSNVFLSCPVMDMAVAPQAAVGRVSNSATADNRSMNRYRRSSQRCASN